MSSFTRNEVQNAQAILNKKEVCPKLYSIFFALCKLYSH